MCKKDECKKGGLEYNNIVNWRGTVSHSYGLFVKVCRMSDSPVPKKMTRKKREDRMRR